MSAALDWMMAAECACGSGFETVKRGHYCSNTCRKAAHSARKAIA